MTKVNIKIKPESETFKMPIKGSEDAACYDVFADRIEVDPAGFVICHLGFSTEIPKGWKGIVVPRSNITKYGWDMLNTPGQIDSDYRNEWQARFTPIINGGDTVPVVDKDTVGIGVDYRNVVDACKYFPYKVGERCAQIYFEEVNEVEFEVVNKTSGTKRGLGGFGSTGK